MNTGNIMKEAGPLSMTFTIPMYKASGKMPSNLFQAVSFRFIK
jgi:hypothetical protein